MIIFDKGVEVTEDNLEGSLSPLDETINRTKRAAKRSSGPCLETTESMEEVPCVTVEPAPRPTDLPLRPPRRTDKTRDTRLLSVPNIKYQHTGLQAFKRKISKSLYQARHFEITKIHKSSSYLTTKYFRLFYDFLPLLLYLL